MVKEKGNISSIVLIILCLDEMKLRHLANLWSCKLIMSMTQ